jgi:hypothetical protein
MTAEPRRDEDTTVSEPTDEQVTEEAAVTEPQRPEASVAEASASAENESSEAIDPTATAVVETTVKEPPAVEAATLADAPPVGATESTAADQATAPDMRSRRLAAIAAGRRVAAFLIAVALFLAGLRLGYVLHEMNRPAASVASQEGPGSVQPPPIAREFITALASNDADALRSSLDAQQHQDLTGEMTRFGIHRIAHVEILGTEMDGSRSATEILMKAEDSDGLPFAINLVILVDSGKIEGFR